MKTIITCIFLVISLLSFSQEKKTISSGYITFNSGSIVNFKNLTIENQEIKYLNEVSQKEMTFSIGAVKKIVDNTGAVIYEAEGTVMSSLDTGNSNKKVVADKKEEEKLFYISSNKITLNKQQLDKQEIRSILEPNNLYYLYKEGKNNAALGSILIGGGIGLFVGGGIGNIMSANDGRNGGGPAILIVGIATSLVGIPIKLSGNKKIKTALQRYNDLPSNSAVSYSKTDLKIVAGSAGIGFRLQF